MKKVTFLLILSLFNILGTFVAQGQVHGDEHIHTFSEAMTSVSHLDFEKPDHQQDDHNDCGASDCCRHCHNVVFINSPIRLITSAPSFLLSFREQKLQVSESYFEIIKPPLA